MPDMSLRDLKDGLRQIRIELDDLEETFAARRRAAASREPEYKLAALRFETALIRYVNACRKAGFNPNQPRMPAGNPQGGQWTGDGSTSRIGGGITSDVRLADAGVASAVMSDAIPDPIVPGSQYAQIYVRRNDKTGNPQIDRTTETLMQTLLRAHASVGEGSGAAYGILVHGAFGSAVKDQDLPGIGRAGVEQSFSLGDIARYGLDGSIRTDVVMRDPNSPNGRPIAIWENRPREA
jgi:hypothetical protein